VRARLLRIDGAAGERELCRPRTTDDGGQQPSTPVARDQPELDEAAGEPCVVAGDADVAHTGEVQARADRMSVDCRDRRYFEAVQCQRQALDAVAICMPRQRRQPQSAAHLIADRLDIAPRGEGVAGAGQHHRTHRMVGIDVRTRLQQRFDRIRVRHRVVRLGPVHGQHRHMAVAANVEKVCHVIAPFERCCCFCCCANDRVRIMRSGA